MMWAVYVTTQFICMMWAVIGNTTIQREITRTSKTATVKPVRGGGTCITHSWNYASGGSIEADTAQIVGRAKPVMGHGPSYCILLSRRNGCIFHPPKVSVPRCISGIDESHQAKAVAPTIRGANSVHLIYSFIKETSWKKLKFSKTSVQSAKLPKS